MGKKIERAKTAESVGVSSKEIQCMIDDMKNQGVELHSLMVLRHGKVACEAWKAPRTSENAHMVYSISKSFLSVAYGFALEEGLLKENTRFLDVFPELAPEKRDENLEKLELLQLLSMTAGKRTSRTRENWLKSFVEAKWDFAPGEGWRYVNESYYAASAALVKLSGMSITEYLTPRLYEPLDMEIPFWETSPQNVEAGGWGMFLKTEDIAKFILCCHQGGVYEGKQILPKAWIKMATSKCFDNADVESASDSKAGYGYGFWRCAGMENTFRCEGMYSQYAISFGDQDACLVLTGECVDLQKTLDIVWPHMKKAFIEEDEKTDGIQIQIPPSKAFAPTKRSPLEKKINGRVYKLRKQKFIDRIGYPTSAIPMPATAFAKDKGGDISNLSFVFDENSCTMRWSESEKYRNTQRIAMDGGFANGEIQIGELKFQTAAFGRWLDEENLEVVIQFLAAVADRRLVFHFKGNRISMQPDMIPSMDERAKFIGEKLKCVLKGRYFEWWINVLVPRVKYLLQPTHHGKAN